MPFPLLGMLLGAGGGLLKHAAIDKPQADSDIEASATQTEFSPWTHMGKGRDVEAPNPLGSMAQLGMAGAGLQQASDTALAQDGMLKSYKGFMDRGGGPLPPPLPTAPMAQGHSGAFQTAGDILGKGVNLWGATPDPRYAQGIDVRMGGRRR